MGCGMPLPTFACPEPEGTGRAESQFFARWGITTQTPPGEVMMAIERSRQPEDRWRGFGLVFGYPQYAIDFFVTAGMHQRVTGEFVRERLQQIGTFSGNSGRFVYAVPKLSRSGPEDIRLQRDAAKLLPSTSNCVRDTPARRMAHEIYCGIGWRIVMACATQVICLQSSPREPNPTWMRRSHLGTRPKFGHLRLNQSSICGFEPENFEAIRTSDFLLQQFAASDQGFPKFLPIDHQCQSIYLRGATRTSKFGA